MPTPISSVPYYHDFAEWLDKFALPEKHEELWKFADSIWNSKPGQAPVKPEGLSDHHAIDIIGLLMDARAKLPVLETTTDTGSSVDHRVDDVIEKTATGVEKWITDKPMHPVSDPVVKAQLKSALEVQVAGKHYVDKAIQPVEYIHANGLGFLEGCIVKRITRWRDKDGFTDLEKIKHEVDLLIELERRSGNRAVRSS